MRVNFVHTRKHLKYNLCVLDLELFMGWGKYMRSLGILIIIFSPTLQNTYCLFKFYGYDLRKTNAMCLSQIRLLSKFNVRLAHPTTEICARLWTQSCLKTKL